MAHYKMIVLTNFIEGKEAEFNTWYDEVHVPQVLTIPGMVSAQRYKSRIPMIPEPAVPYATIYEVETDDIDGVMATFGEMAATGKMHSNAEVFDPTTAIGAVYEVNGPEQKA